MRTNERSRVDTTTREDADVKHWSWSGILNGEKGQEFSYRGMINIGPDEEIHISLYDGTDSYVANLGREGLQKICESPSLARVDPNQRISRIQAALRSNDKEATRVIRNGDSVELRISAAWGSEFGDLSVRVDIAGIPLHRVSGNASLVDAVRESLKTDRPLSCELRKQRHELELEVEELWEAHKRLELITRTRQKRMQVFADALNEYKRKVSAKSTK